MEKHKQQERKRYSGLDLYEGKGRRRTEPFEKVMKSYLIKGSRTVLGGCRQKKIEGETSGKEKAMKNVKRMMAGIMAVMLCIVMALPALADVNITVNRDDTTYEEGGTSESGNRSYTYFQIFRATENGNHSSTGGGYNANTGAPGDVSISPANGITYYLDSAADSTQIGQLGAWNDGTWTKANGNDWFNLIKSADGSRYTVVWDNAEIDSNTVQSAANWLRSNYTALDEGPLAVAADGKSWTASNLPEGYYLLQGETGSNLIAAATDITVNEKNSYPTVDKKQKDNSSSEVSYGDDPINVKIGDTVYYEVEIKVPANANADIIVTDTMSTGLTFNSSSAPEFKVGTTSLTADDTAADHDYTFTPTDSSWNIIIHPTSATKGHTVVITFTATVNNDALTSINRKNDVELVYGNYRQTDTVEYDIGAAAIIKYDGATARLDTTSNSLSPSGTGSIKYLEATFTLTDSSENAVNVREAASGTKGVYVVDTNATTNTVTSDKAHNGVILIYGLDPGETYTLTETATEDGYNLMSQHASVTPAKAENATVNTIKVTVAEASGVTAGNANADEADTLVLDAAHVSKIENNSGSVLPSTGGIGTTIFYIVGAILVVIAGVLLVTRRRMKDE